MRIRGKRTGKIPVQFEVPASWKGKIIRLVFDGSMTDTEAWSTVIGGACSSGFLLPVQV